MNNFKWFYHILSNFNFLTSIGTLVWIFNFFLKFSYLYRDSSMNFYFFLEFSFLYRYSSMVYFFFYCVLWRVWRVRPASCGECGECVLRPVASVASVASASRLLVSNSSLYTTLKRWKDSKDCSVRLECTAP